MADSGEGEKSWSQEALAVMLTGFMEVTHLALVELIKSRGGIGPWFDEFQAKVIRELKNPLTEGVGMSDEVQLTDVTIHMTNVVFAGVKSDFDGECSG
jgi:hypothetical protein